MQLRRKLFFSHLGLALLVAALCLGFGVQVARHALVERAKHQLESVRTLKKLKVEGMLDNYRAYFGVYRGKLAPFPEESWREFIAGAQFAPDYFGVVAWNAEKRVTHRSTEEMHPEELDSAWLNSLSEMPTYREGKCDTGVRRMPCLWLGKKIASGYLALQFTLRGVGTVMTTHVGLGETGESYLIGQDGFLRTPSRFWDEKKVDAHPIATEPWKAAIENRTGVTDAADYRGIDVLSAFAPVVIDGVRWAMLSEIDREEVLAPLQAMLKIFLLCLLGVLVLGALLAGLTSRRIARPVEATLRRSEERADLQRLRQLGLYEGQELERRRLSLELHDGIGQQLTALSLRISAASLERAEAKKLELATGEIITEVRKISNRLMPGVLSQLGLIPALERLCEETTATSGIKCRFHADGKIATLSKNHEHHIYRLGQEALHNVIKHSQATSSQIALEVEDGKARLTISDDGQGVPEAERGQAMSHLRERVEALAGEIRIETVGNCGTVVKISFPQAEEG